jgi:uncharacterized delta-60 repeat protein
MAPRDFNRYCAIASAGVLAVLPLRAGAAPGDVDAGFQPTIDSGLLAGVHAIAVQPDGKVVIGGEFDFLDGLLHQNFGRLQSNGSVDAEFGFASYVDSTVSSIAVQRDGKLVLTGSFTDVAGEFHERLVRLGGNGAPDGAFALGTNFQVWTTSLAADGALVIAGQFTNLAGVVRQRLARISAVGAIDSALKPAVAGLGGAIYCSAIQPDGKILIAGDFATVGGVSRPYLARVNVDGSLDAAFQPEPNGIVGSLALAPDGKILIGGGFRTVGASARSHLARLHANGSVDPSFAPGVNQFVSSIALQADGKMVIGGYFTNIDATPRAHLARLHSDGALDTGFAAAANGRVCAVALQADGQILVGGFFTTINGVSRAGVARLANDLSNENLAVTDASRVVWLRGGSAPEARAVRFDLSTDGGASWIELGEGRRIAGGWEVTGLDLPPSGTVRARALTSGGEANASTGIVESLRTFPAMLENWRVTKFGANAVNLEIAGDHADPDGDGLPNFIEYFLASEPLETSPAESANTEAVDGHLTITFTRDPTRIDVHGIVQAGSDLSGWIDLAASYGGAPVQPLVTGVGVAEQIIGPLRKVTVSDPAAMGDPAHRRRFLRLKVTR